MMSSSFYVSYAAVWVLVLLHSIILLGVVTIVYQLQRSGGMRRSATGGGNERLVPGQEAPSFNAVDISGAQVNSRDLAGRLRALLFVSPSCRSCSTTLAEMRAISYKANERLVVICRAGREDCARLAEGHQLDVQMVADEDDRIGQLFGISSVPTAVLIDQSDRIQSYGHPLRREELEGMLESREGTAARA